jgi:hypothetical protein
LLHEVRCDESALPGHSGPIARARMKLNTSRCSLLRIKALPKQCRDYSGKHITHTG